jgi:hypothetical protein
MNPLLLFDYIFYRIAYFYDNRFNYEESKELSGIAILNLFETFNFFIVLNYFRLDTKVSKNIYVLSFILSYIVLFILNYIRYIKIIKYNELEYKWDSEGGIGRLIKSFFIIFYFIITFVLFIKI